MSKVLLAPISVIPQFNSRGQPVNIVSEDGCAMAMDLLDRFGYEQVDILSSSKYQPRFKNINVVDFWHDDVWDFSKYDEVIVYSQAFLMFGGHVQKHVVKFVDALARRKEFALFANDPIHFGKYSYIDQYVRRLFESETKYSFDEGFDPREYHKSVDDIRNIGKFYEGKGQVYTNFPNLLLPLNQTFNDVQFIDIVRYVFSEVREQHDSFFIEHRKNKICYLGANRPERVKRLKEINCFDIIDLKGSIANPFSDKKTRNTKTNDGNAWQREYQAALILSDKGNINSGLVHRLVQGLATDCVSFIDARMDPHENLILNEELRNFLYFDTEEELRNKFTSMNYEYIINLQQKELQRILTEPVDRLVARTSI